MRKRRGNSEGSIYHMKDGRWRSAISIGFRDGKPIRKVYTGATRGEVSDRLKQALRDQQLGLPIVGEKGTVGHFLDHWLEHVATNKVRRSTLESYRWITEKHLIPGLGRYTLSKLSAQQIQSFLSDRLKFGRQPLPRRSKSESLKNTGPKKPDQPSNPGLAPRTVQHIHATLRTALDQALRWNLVARNVAALVDAPRVRRQEVQPYTPDEAHKLLDTLKGNRLEALYSAAMAVGLRQGEALGLKWSDIDFSSGMLTVRKSLQRIDGKLQLVEVKAQKSRRTIVLPRVAVSALLAHQNRQEQERRFAGDRWRETGFVFTTALGTPLDGSNVTHRFQAALKAGGLRRIRFHDLRHTCATLLLAQGVHPRLIMDILGHSQIAITMNLYAHVLPAMQREVAAQMDAILTTPSSIATAAATKRASENVN